MPDEVTMEAGLLVNRVFRLTMLVLLIGAGYTLLSFKQNASAMLLTPEKKKNEVAPPLKTEVVLSHGFFSPRFRLIDNHTIYSSYKYVVASEFYDRPHDIKTALNDTLAYNEIKNILFVWIIQGGRKVPSEFFPEDLSYLIYETDVFLYGFSFLFLSQVFPSDKVLVYRNIDVSIRSMHLLTTCTFNNTFYFLSRYSGDIDCAQHAEMGSNDVYIFQNTKENAVSLRKAFESMNFDRNYWGGENLAAYILKDHGLNLINLCPYMFSYHFHTKGGIKRYGTRYRINLLSENAERGQARKYCGGKA